MRKILLAIMLVMFLVLNTNAYIIEDPDVVDVNIGYDLRVNTMLIEHKNYYEIVSYKYDDETDTEYCEHEFILKENFDFIEYYFYYCWC